MSKNAIPKVGHFVEKTKFYCKEPIFIIISKVAQKSQSTKD
jgi:hypothetical protein